LRCGLRDQAALDAYQDAWAIAYLEGPPEGDYGPWIQGIARKVAFRYRRSAARAAAVFVHDDFDGIAPSSDPETAAYAREVARAVDVLDPREREAIVAAAEGCTAAEIAEIAAEDGESLTENGAKSRVARARKAMRSRMKDDEDDKAVMLPPFDGERMWRRVERVIDKLDELHGAPDDGPSMSTTPSTPPMAVPLAPLGPLLGPGILPIAKGKLAGLLLGTFLLGAGAGAAAMHTWHAHRHRPDSPPIAKHPPVVEGDVERVVEQAPGVVWTASNRRYARPRPKGNPSPTGKTTPRPESTFYERARRDGF
jgi:DNA-directed RNA polymerase specialized sigma24 family protein